MTDILINTPHIAFVYGISPTLIIIMVATALHAIATGNMTPAYIEEANGTLRELPTICVDSSEFVVSKLPPLNGISW